MQSRAHLGFLFKQLLQRELSSRYRGTALGVSWLVLQPLMMLAVYTLVFGIIFRSRWAGAETTSDFAMLLFAGLIIFNLFSEVIVASPGLVVGQPSYVKKVVFPVAMLGGVRVAAALATSFVALLILVLARSFLDDIPSPWMLITPLILLELTPLLLAVAWLGSGLGVYLRDLGQIVSVLASVLLFVSPIFFPADAMPPQFKAIVVFNPLVVPIEEFRNAAILDVPPDFIRLARHFLLSTVFMLLCLGLFRRLSRGFADVL